MKSSLVLLVAAGALALQAGCNLEDRPRAFVASLSGQAQVPPVRTEAKGRAWIEINRERTRMQFKIDLANVRDVRAAHIHLASKGKSGPAVIEMYGGPEKPGLYTGTLTEGTLTGIRFVDALQGKSMAELLRSLDAHEAYLDIKTRAHPDGELRGWFR